MRLVFLFLVFHHVFATAQFTEHQIVSCETCRPRLIKVADINSDGILDILVSSQFDEKLSYYPGLGNRNFGKQKIISTEIPYVNFLKILDFNNDGYIDIVLESRGKLELTYLKGMGNGKFTPNNLTNTPKIKNHKYSYSAIHNDLDGNGYPEYIVGDINGNFKWYECNDGKFTRTKNFIKDKRLKDVFRYYFEDINNDDVVDIITISKRKDKINIYTALSGNTYDEQILDFDGARVYSIDFGSPFDKGHKPLLVSSDKGIYSLYSANDRKVEYDISDVFAVKFLGSPNARYADINGDGAADIYFEQAKKVGAIINTNGSINNQKPISKYYPDLINYLIVSDVDQDGLDDAIFAHDNELSIQFGEKNEIIKVGTWPRESQYSKLLTESLYFPTSIAVTDVNNDGAPDIISASTIDHEINWFENIGGAYPSKEVLYKLKGCGKDKIKVGDFDMNGTVDFINHASGTNRCFTFFNKGAGEFSKTNNSLTKDSQPYLMSRDLDGDGDLDLITRTYDENIFIHENDGNGKFLEKRHIYKCPKFSIRDWKIEDIDNDGNKDLVLMYADRAPRIGNNVMLGKQTGGLDIVYLDENQEVIESYDHQYDIKPYKLELADLNNDGYTDILLTVSLKRDYIDLLINKGTGVFSDKIQVKTNLESSTSCFVYDLDADCDKDIIVASNNDTFAWLENDGQLNFKAYEIKSTHSLKDVYFHDVDGDLDVDIISRSDNSLEWFENKITQHQLYPCGFAKEYQSKSIQEEEYQISTYPNPTSGLLKVKSDISTQLSIYNSNGLKIKSEPIFEGINNISLSEFPPSVYFLEFFSIEHKFRSIKKVIKTD